MTAPAPDPAILAAFWTEASRQVATLPPLAEADVWFFGDSPTLAQSLADLVLKGLKRATTGLVAEMQAQGWKPVRVGGLSLVTDFHGTPLMVLCSTRVDVLPFNQVDADFAAAEGEGDGSLAYWQAAHEAYFKRSCARLGLTWRPDMDVICERFEILYPKT